MDRVEQVVEEIRAAQGEIEAIHETAHSPDGLVAATVSGSGRILELDLNPRIYRHHDTQALSRQILAAVDEATAHAQRQVTEVIGRLAPSGRG